MEVRANEILVPLDSSAPHKKLWAHLGRFHEKTPLNARLSTVQSAPFTLYFIVFETDEHYFF